MSTKVPEEFDYSSDGEKSTISIFEVWSMETSRKGPPSIPFNGFKLRFSFDHNGYITIEAERKDASKFYKVHLTNSEVEKITQGILSTGKQLYELIQYAKQNKDPGIKIFISKDVEITITQNIKLGPFESKLQICVPLDETSYKPLQVCGKYISEIDEEYEEEKNTVNSEFVRVFKKLIENGDLLEEKLQKAIQRIKKLENNMGISK